MQEWFNICNLVSVIQHTDKSTEKNHIIILIDAEKAFNKIQYPFVIEALQKLEIKGSYLNIIKAMLTNL
jgi:hypothetical protein